MSCIKINVFIIYLVILCSLKYVYTAPRNVNALEYLSHYGYLPPLRKDSSQLLDISSYKKAIKDFQAFAGLDITGKLDAQTRATMSLPRCGVKDKVGTGHNRSKRYVLNSRWNKKNLSYKLRSYPRWLIREEVDREIQRAFNVWSQFTDLSFTPKSGQVDIELIFAEGYHGDDDPFDGPGKVLAHAFFPRYGGDIHFDASESWSINSDEGQNLFQTAVHEIGHSLGLEHSSVRDSVMFAWAKKYDQNFNLGTDDIKGIQALYGKKTTPQDDQYYYYKYQTTPQDDQYYYYKYQTTPQDDQYYYYYNKYYF